jgi:hypothetical protein
VLDGELSDRVAAAFHGMTLTREAGHTVLAGEIRDQAELQGLLQQVSELGVELLEVTTADVDPGPATAA